MTTFPCPFCGEQMNSPLRFCVGCGRAVTQQDINKAGLKISRGPESTKRLDGPPNSRDFEKAKRSYGLHRQVRTFLLTSSVVIAAVIAYYFSMHYVLHEPIPYNVDLMIERLFSSYQQPQ
jgi:hypothetical protein